MARLYRVNSPYGKIKTEIMFLGRGGSKSPEMWVIKYKGRLITPFEQRLKGWSFPLDTLLKKIYKDEIIANLVYNENPFLAMIKPDSSWGSKYIPIPMVRKN